MNRLNQRIQELQKQVQTQKQAQARSARVSHVQLKTLSDLPKSKEADEQKYKEIMQIAKNLGNLVEQVKSSPPADDSEE